MAFERWGLAFRKLKRYFTSIRRDVMIFFCTLNTRSALQLSRLLGIVALVSFAPEAPLTIAGLSSARALDYLPITGEDVRVDEATPRELHDVEIAGVEIYQWHRPKRTGCRSPGVAGGPEYFASIDISLSEPADTDGLAFELRFGGVGERWRPFNGQYFGTDSETGLLEIRIATEHAPVFSEGSLTVEVRTVSTPEIAGEWSAAFEMDIDGEIEVF